MPDKSYGEIIEYQLDDSLSCVDVRFDVDTVWLALDQLALLFGRDKSTISRHLKNIFAEGELTEDSGVANFLKLRRMEKLIINYFCYSYSL